MTPFQIIAALMRLQDRIMSQNRLTSEARPPPTVGETAKGMCSASLPPPPAAASETVASSGAAAGAAVLPPGLLKAPDSKACQSRIVVGARSGPS